MPMAIPTVMTTTTTATTTTTTMMILLFSAAAARAEVQARADAERLQPTTTALRHELSKSQPLGGQPLPFHEKTARH